MTTLTQRQRIEIIRQPMPEQDPGARVSNYNEVALGFTPELAQQEAERCLQCARPHCVEGCPVGVLIPEFVAALRNGDMLGAVQAMKVHNSLPAICGRVCPQEVQCEQLCVLARRGEPVAIGRLERFVGDFELMGRTCPLQRAEPTGKKVAVVGSGPAGITCAVDVARDGHEVVIYESLHSPGGVLVYGIPEFRLPKSVVNGEIDYAVECLGIDIRLDHVIGRILTTRELLSEYDAIFLGTGAGLPSFMPIPGINLNGVMSANEFLTRVNLMKGYRFPEYDTPVKVGDRVAVIGAGNVAMDAARCSLRLQSLRRHGHDDHPEVHIVYRRSMSEVPARAEEVHHAEEEGVIFDFLAAPVEILGNAAGGVSGIRCIRMELGQPDASGRRRPVPIKGSEYLLDADTVIFALGTSPNPLVLVDSPELERTRWGTVVADEQTGRTKLRGVWAGGDVVTGAATVVSAMGAGRRAAADIIAFLKDKEPRW